MCDCSSDSIQEKFNEDDFEPLTKAKYEEIEQTLRYSNEKMIEGVKKYCILNDLKYYHQTNNFAFDITHDLYEGIVPFHIKLIIHQFVRVDKYFTIEVLNERIINFCYGNVDKSNKQIQLTYVQINELEHLIQEFQSGFKELFPNETLKKKHHNLIHYPRSFRMLGNLIDFSTIRFEAKHSMFKTASHSTKNFRNIIKTVIRKHQILNCYNLSYQSLLNSEHEINKFKEIDFYSIEENIKNVLKQVVKNGSPVIIRDIEIIKVYGTLLRSNMSLLFDVTGTKLVGKILNIYEVQNIIYFHVKVLKIDSYNSHYCAYRVNDSNTSCLFNINQIKNYHPFNDYNTLDIDNSSKFVLPYFSIDFI